MKNMQFSDSEFLLLLDLLSAILSDLPSSDDAGGFYLPESKTIDLSDVDLDEIRNVNDKFMKIHFE